MTDTAKADAPRRRGRPPGSKNKTPEERLASAPPKKRKRGRPTGSKPKVRHDPDAAAQAATMATEAVAEASRALVEIIPPGARSGNSRGGGSANADADQDGEWPRTRGRKPKLYFNEFTVMKIWQLAFVGCSQKTAASKLSVSHKTFQRFLVEHKEAREAWEDAPLCFDADMRAMIAARAMAGDTALLQFFTKKYFGDGGAARAGEEDEGDVAITLDPKKMTIEQRQALKVLLTGGGNGEMEQ